MLPLSPKYAGSTCELKTMENDLLTVCRIIKIDHGALEFSAGKSGRMPLIQYRQPVKLLIHNAVLKDQVLVGSAYLSTNTFLRVEDVRPLSNFERRGAFRVNTGFEGRLYPFLSEQQQLEFNLLLEQATPEETQKLIDASYSEVQVMDISLTGTRLKTKQKLMLGENYYLEFKMFDENKRFGIKVQRIIEMKTGAEQFGCTFFDMSDSAVDALCRDLFQLQRLEKNRKSNAAY